MWIFTLGGQQTALLKIYHSDRSNPPEVSGSSAGITATLDISLVTYFPATRGGDSQEITSHLPDN
ncbi:hypothetical protein [Nostoc sp.]|uniref:hypothetical protein n=1 Tax=Nostoc sp. TaxID=1180 RepID=UPI002FF5A616